MHSDPVIPLNCCIVNTFFCKCIENASNCAELSYGLMHLVLLLSFFLLDTIIVLPHRHINQFHHNVNGSGLPGSAACTKFIFRNSNE